MAGNIPRDFIDEVLARADIIEVIDSRVPLKKSGNNYMACCPFHNEKTPSFSVNASGQYYHCFGCGVSGNAISFLMDYEHQGFIEAVEELATQVGLKIPQTSFSKDQHQQSLQHYDVMQQVSDYYQRQLSQSGDSAAVIQYIRQRGLSAEIIKQFGLGYSPPGWDNLIKRFAANNDDKLKQLHQLGMLIQKEDGDKSYYDRFRERLMFPIRDRRGRVIGFGGRIIGDGKPKYLNSPETPLFHKGQELYGLYELKQALRKITRVLVVEGYMDVVSLVQFGIPYAVATLGTATTTEHLDKLFRLTDEVIFCFDGDNAGREAAWRAMQNALPGIKPGKQAKFMFLPEGEDPDTLIRNNGKEEFEVAVDGATEFSTFFFSNLMQQVNMQSLDGRSRLIDLCKPYLTKIPAGSFQTLMIARLSELADINAEEVYALLGLAVSNQASGKRTAVKTPVGNLHKQAPLPISKAIAYLLQFPALAELAGDPGRFSGLELKDIDVFIKLLDMLQNEPHLNTARILLAFENTHQKEYLEDISITPLLLDDEQAVQQEFKDIMRFLTRQYQQQRFEKLQYQQKTLGLNSVEKREYIQLINSLKQTK